MNPSSNQWNGTIWHSQEIKIQECATGKKIHGCSILWEYWYSHEPLVWDRTMNSHYWNETLQSLNPHLPQVCLKEKKSVLLFHENVRPRRFEHHWGHRNMWMYSVAAPTLQSLPCTIALSPVWPFERKPVRTPLHENKALQYTMHQMLHKKDTACNGCDYMLFLISKKTADKNGDCIKK
jgi:hypothetical protein